MFGVCFMTDTTNSFKPELSNLVERLRVTPKLDGSRFMQLECTSGVVQVCCNNGIPICECVDREMATLVINALDGHFGAIDVFLACG